MRHIKCSPEFRRKQRQVLREREYTEDRTLTLHAADPGSYPSTSYKPLVPVQSYS